ncbi:hypothetical protein [Dictyobacter halimunensis]|uniref:hypothetical protein n=1 Tax=Dictyobacter halimunensis TaxID=3026934 RepID=UPI0030C74CE6
MPDQPPLTADAVEAFVASLRQRLVPANTVKSYAHDLRLFLRAAPMTLPEVHAETVRARDASRVRRCQAM